MTSSNMGGLVLAFFKYIFIGIGAICGVAAMFTSSWLMILLTAGAGIFWGLAMSIHIQLKRAEKAAYDSRRETEASMRRNNPFYDAMRTLTEIMQGRKLSHFTTGQRTKGGATTFDPRVEYLIVRAEVEQVDGNGQPSVMKGGMPVSLWRSKVPTVVGIYPVTVEFIDATGNTISSI